MSINVPIEKHNLRTARKMQAFIKSLGYDLRKPGSGVKLRLGGYMPLTIEHFTLNRISVCHYGEMNGDLMRDPEIVFAVINEEWIPLSFRNDYLGVHNQVMWLFMEPDLKVNLVGHKEAYNDLVAFAETMWVKNLKDQGWLSAQTDWHIKGD